jgi:hypothetical protein
MCVNPDPLKKIDELVCGAEEKGLDTGTLEEISTELRKLDRRVGTYPITETPEEDRALQEKIARACELARTSGKRVYLCDVDSCLNDKDVSLEDLRQNRHLAYLERLVSQRGMLVMEAERWTGDTDPQLVLGDLMPDELGEGPMMFCKVIWPPRDAADRAVTCTALVGPIDRTDDSMKGKKS